MGINLSESEWCRKATPEVPCRTQGISHIKLPAKLLDYFLRSNTSNINQKLQAKLLDYLLRFQYC